LSSSALPSSVTNLRFNLCLGYPFVIQPHLRHLQAPSGYHLGRLPSGTDLAFSLSVFGYPSAVQPFLSRRVVFGSPISGSTLPISFLNLGYPPVVHPPSLSTPPPLLPVLLSSVIRSYDRLRVHPYTYTTFEHLEYQHYLAQASTTQHDVFLRFEISWSCR
jgi:hypothetical protein